jgi:signal transduction histidine kinase
MNPEAWFLPAVILAGTGIGGTAVFAMLWWRARRSLRRRDNSRLDAENRRFDAELTSSELRDRIRLMTEMHDGAAATITSIVSQAEGARYAAAIDADVATRMAGQIADQARQALADVRRVVNVGRSGVSEAKEQRHSFDDLFQAVEASGLVVKFEESGTRFEVNSSAELAIFRILQEALNNAREYGGAGVTVKVSMAWTANGVQLRVEDDGTRVATKMREELGESGGYSIADDQQALVERLEGRGMEDMRTRTEAFGGVFSSHRIPGVGVSVSASFPTLRFQNGLNQGAGDTGKPETEKHDESA